MVRIKIYSPPAAAIMWNQLAIHIQECWARPADMRSDMGFSQQTTMNAWHGRSVGLIPYLRLCRKLGVSPYSMLAER